MGYEPGKGARAALGSLILAVNEGKELHYAGEVGSGLDNRTIKQLKTELDAHRVDAPPVVDAPRIKGAVWSEPRLVVRVEFSEWTDDGLLRQAAYKGLEIGKNPQKVVRERAISARKAADAAEKEAAAAAPKPPKTAGSAKSASGAKSAPVRSPLRRSRSLVPARSRSSSSSKTPTNGPTHRRRPPMRRWPPSRECPRRATGRSAATRST